jgi:hypothetical protein
LHQSAAAVIAFRISSFTPPSHVIAFLIQLEIRFVLCAHLRIAISCVCLAGNRLLLLLAS